MHYNKLTKAQLIDHIGELEKQTINYKLDSFLVELILLREDLFNVVKTTYNQGCRVRKSIGNLSPIYLNIRGLINSDSWLC